MYMVFEVCTYME